MSLRQAQDDAQKVIVGRTGGRRLCLALGPLRGRVKEGTVIRVTVGPDGRRDWSSAEIDETERPRRLKAARQLLKKLVRSDPGGDIRL